MKVATLLTGLAITGMIALGNASLHPLQPAMLGTAIGIAPAAAAESGPSVQEKIALVTKNKGQIGGGDQLRRFFFGDLEPIGIQPGGAGMVVNLYNKANDVTFSYCSTYDVVVAVKSGKVAKFDPKEVK
jgi:hypothetical protein